jgi:hypothetical protein
MKFFLEKLDPEAALKNATYGSILAAEGYEVFLLGFFL